MHCSDCYSNAALQVASASAGWLVAASDKLLLTWAKCNQHAGIASEKLSGDLRQNQTIVRNAAR